jgi:hypothetical protein
MKRTTKYALLAASVLAVAATAQAQYTYGDLLVGFTGGSQDFIYDLGQVSSLTLGETWNIGAGLGTQFGVVGASSISAGSHIYATSADSGQNGYVMSGNWSVARANIATLDQGLTVRQSRTTTSSDTTGWYMQTAQPAGTPGNYLFNNLDNPNAPVNTYGYETTAYFFDNVNGTATPDSFFSYDTASGNLAFGAVAVPEPTTFSLLGGFGLLALAIRRQLAKV